jgi:hypothetical protein
MHADLSRSQISQRYLWSQSKIVVARNFKSGGFSFHSASSHTFYDTWRRDHSLIRIYYFRLSEGVFKILCMQCCTHFTPHKTYMHIRNTMIESKRVLGIWMIPESLIKILQRYCKHLQWQNVAAVFSYYLSIFKSLRFIRNSEITRKCQYVSIPQIFSNLSDWPVSKVWVWDLPVTTRAFSRASVDRVSLLSACPRIQQSGGSRHYWVKNWRSPFFVYTEVKGTHRSVNQHLSNDTSNLTSPNDV